MSTYSCPDRSISSYMTSSVIERSTKRSGRDMNLERTVVFGKPFSNAIGAKAREFNKREREPGDRLQLKVTRKEIAWLAGPKSLDRLMQPRRLIERAGRR